MNSYQKFFSSCIVLLIFVSQVFAESNCEGRKCLDVSKSTSVNMVPTERKIYQNFFVKNSDSSLFAKVFYQGDLTLVEVYDANSQNLLNQWKISDFKAHSIEFSPHNPQHLLLGDSHNILVYAVGGTDKRLLFIRPRLNISKVKTASFGIEPDEIIWTTENSAFVTNYKSRSEKETRLKRSLQHPIQTIVPLKEKRLALAEKDQKQVKVISQQRPPLIEVIPSREHDVLKVFSPNGERLYIVDKSGNVSVWDSKKKKVLEEIKIVPPEKEAVLKAVDLDRGGDKLLFAYQGDNGLIGKIVSLQALERDAQSSRKASLSITDAGNVYYSSFYSIVSQNLSKVPFENRDIKSTAKNVVRPFTYEESPRKKKNTILDLAIIETDNKNYEKALRFIKEISTRSEDYKASRELQRKIYDLISVRSDVDAAIEQYNSGSLKTAEILLEKALSKSPKNDRAKRYFELIKSKQSRSFWNKILILLSIIAMSGLAIGGWFKWYGIKIRNTKKRSVSKKTGEHKTSKNANEKRELAHLIFLTKELLKQSVLRDPQNKYKNKWLEFATRINLLEKRSKLPSTDIKDSISQLVELQKSIKNMVKLKFKRDQYTSHYHHKKSRGEQKRAGQKKDKEKKEVPDEKEKIGQEHQYYEILDIPQGATKEEIKKAYRKKIKQYHPDLHDASEFTWVKEEARKMTQKIQDAYECLINNPQIK